MSLFLKLFKTPLSNKDRCALLVVDMVNVLYGFAKKSNRKIFYDQEIDYPELSEIKKNYLVIRDELDQILQQRSDIPRYHEVDPYMSRISLEPEPQKNWRTFVLYCFGEKPQKNRELCPNTCAILDKIPGICQAFFSILEGGKSITPHYGPFYGVVRYHLALKVPKTNPPSIRIYDQTYTWQAGECVMFDDTFEHEVINTSEEDRVVLFIDVARKDLPIGLRWLNKLIFATLATHYGKRLMQNISWNH